MRQRLAAAAIALMLAVPAPAADWWVPSPVSVAITVGQWLIKDREQVYYVRVQAVGRNETDAREQAFRLAVEQAIGALILAETEVRDGDVDRHEIISYSSGFVHDFEILDRRSQGADVSIMIDVWVKRSNLADRVLNRSKASGTVEGGRITEQIRSWRNEREAGDRVLAAVLRDYPYRAYDIKVHSTEVRVDNQRQAFLRIPFTVNWNAGYVTSFAEALRTINQRPECDSWLATCRPSSIIEASGVRAFFDDTVAYDLMYTEMIQDRPQILITIRNAKGQTRYQACHGAKEIDHNEYSNWRFVDIGGLTAKIHQDRVRRYDAWVPLDRLMTQDLDRVEITMTRIRQCP